MQMKTEPRMFEIQGSGQDLNLQQLRTSRQKTMAKIYSARPNME